MIFTKMHSTIIHALPFRYSGMGKWSGKTTIYDKDAPNGARVGETEIDLLAIDRGETAYLVGECKYKVEPFTYGEYHKTRVKLSPLKEKASFYYALFSRSGSRKRSLLRLRPTAMFSFSTFHRSFITNNLSLGYRTSCPGGEKNYVYSKRTGLEAVSEEAAYLAGSLYG